MAAGTTSFLPLVLQSLTCMYFTFTFCFNLLGLGLFNMIYNCLYVAIIISISNILEENICYILFSIMSSETEVPVVGGGSGSGASVAVSYTHLTLPTNREV